MEILNCTRTKGAFKATISLCVKTPEETVRVAGRWRAAGRQLLRLAGENPDEYMLFSVIPGDSRFDMRYMTHRQIFETHFVKSIKWPCTSQ